MFTLLYDRLHKLRIVAVFRFFALHEFLRFVTQTVTKPLNNQRNIITTFSLHEGTPRRSDGMLLDSERHWLQN
jgi:hypothetical protein